MDPEGEPSKLVSKRLASRAIDYMAVLDDMMKSIEKYLQQEGVEKPWHGRPFVHLTAIEYEKVVKLTAELSLLLVLYGQLRTAKQKVGKVQVGGVIVATPDAKQHLGQRNQRTPDQPKKEDDAKKEADWLEAAMTMQEILKYVKNSELDDMIEDTYGIKKQAFCQNLQKYVWIFLGQGSEEGLPWCHDPDWPTWKQSVSVHPDFTSVLYMWHNGLDIYEILNILGPLSDASLQHAESLKISKSARDESLCP
ncbi:hypothetical protein H634G_06221 [Metarhizium anisopliae BRIP 53293]|uniref:Uncharacterized protein n=1 Tax=Metarhizium anisopliae BRIP 53293 TaxID=1291518 RepID=A0A0D9NXH8_METAN|nr:hypothetical protein H634G_06221 [Metarhizium anisopliae BRIP 53293]KJK85917.1 hypothetical protein H633G_10236 [Metarhizium anisopliae BRIP 53284]